ncbi:extracellular solute-binding protein [Streptomyces sp. DSM 44915]|uniref:Extracellular solute-binding protein n=1 Tax=Streptomyces chisholmiae TaxID=3075540 RepID=A0ABU2JZS9_9ACTN|nr:extracellular solute-binding protein [Streptomyces sp. DSM 44915]MDT0269723.1 extracellular solute-binding protein [Streptomyces sp. DSM 44915]
MRVQTNRLVALTGALALALTVTACGSNGDGDGDTVHLTVGMNAIAGGKNTTEAEWVEEWVIPEFEAAQAARGVSVEVTFEPSGVDDEQYKSRLALDLQSGTGPDIYTLDGIWLGEFAQAGYVRPLADTGQAATDWDGWAQIPDAVQRLATFDGERYGVPAGTDGRVLFYHRRLFAEAGLPADWQPTSWAEILAAGEALARLDGVTPIQLNAGTAMGEATTMQGVLPLLAGTGESIHTEDGRWTGASPGLERVLGLYADVYQAGLGDPRLQQEAQGRDKSFEEFARGEIGILLESDYFWRGVVNPVTGVAPMADRDETVGYALVPAAEPGAGPAGADFVSTSGGNVRVLSSATEHPELAWELLAFMHSAEAVTAFVGDEPRITARSDVNERVLGDDPMLTFVNERVLPVTSYRPALEVYPRVSVLLQEATAAVVGGTDPARAAADYRDGLEEVVDGDDITP